MKDDPYPEAATSKNSIELLAELQTRARTLLADLTALHSYLQSTKRSNEIEIRHFRNNVQSEVKSLEKIPTTYKTIAQNTPDYPHVDIDNEEDEEAEAEAKRLHVLRSSNLPFYEAVWSTAKRCKGVRALGKRMYFDRKWRIDADKHINGDPVSRTSTLPSRKRRGVLVDIIADDGLEWIKVSTITEKRLLFEMAKEGWERYGDDSDIDSYGSNEMGMRNNDDRPGMELVKLAQDLWTTSKQTRVQHRHPRIHFILPKIAEGKIEEVDAVLSDLRATGAIVECGDPSDSTLSDGANSLCLDKEELFSKILPQPLPILTPILNIDCTILLALISDISHLPSSTLPPPPYSVSGSYHAAILRQIDTEQSTPLLPTELYLVLANRELVCTSHAANRMREIVNTMGTPNERARAEVFLAEGSYTNATSKELLHALTSLTTHKTPSTLQIPIKVVPFDPNTISTSSSSSSSTTTFPTALAQQTSQSLQLSEINKSVFLYGWQQHVVTVTSNRVVAVGIEKAIDEILDAEERMGRSEEKMADFEGPRIWVCETARSLVGKTRR